MVTCVGGHTDPASVPGVGRNLVQPMLKYETRGWSWCEGAAFEHGTGQRLNCPVGVL